MCVILQNIKMQRRECVFVVESPFFLPCFLSALHRLASCPPFCLLLFLFLCLIHFSIIFLAFLAFTLFSPTQLSSFSPSSFFIFSLSFSSSPLSLFPPPFLSLARSLALYLYSCLRCLCTVKQTRWHDSRLLSFATMLTWR